MSITLDQVTKRYQGSPVVNDVSLEVGEGEFFVLLGPSGSGKSTVLRMIAGLTDADAGRVHLRGRDVSRLPPRRRGVTPPCRNVRGVSRRRSSPRRRSDWTGRFSETASRSIGWLKLTKPSE